MKYTKYALVALTLLALGACANPDDSFWQKATPEIGHILKR